VEFSWWIFVAVCVANTLYTGILYVAQVLDKNLPARHSIIPGTNQKFLHMQDLYRTVCGDLFGVPLIINAFVHLVARDAANFWWGLIFALIGSVIFLMICLKKDHKPDLGFPKTGKISLNGMLHLPYFGIGIGASIICLWNLFTGYLYGPVMLIAFMGGVFYLICYVAEIKSGNFALLKKIKV